MLCIRIQGGLRSRCKELLYRKRNQFSSQYKIRNALEKISWATRRFNWEKLNNILVSLPDVLGNGVWLVPKQDSAAADVTEKPADQYSVVLKHLTYKRPPVSKSSDREKVLKTLLSVSHDRIEFIRNLGPLKLCYVCTSFGLQAHDVFMETLVQWLSTMIHFTDRRRILAVILKNMDQGAVDQVQSISPIKLPKWLNTIPRDNFCLQILNEYKKIENKPNKCSTSSLYIDLLSVLLPLNASTTNIVMDAVKELGLFFFLLIQWL